MDFRDVNSVSSVRFLFNFRKVTATKRNLQAVGRSARFAYHLHNTLNNNFSVASRVRVKPNHLKKGTSKLLVTEQVRGTNIAGTSFSAVFSSARIHLDDRGKWAALSPNRKACLFQTRRGSLPLPVFTQRPKHALACAFLPSPRVGFHAAPSLSLTSLPLTQYLLRDRKRSEARACALALRVSRPPVSLSLSLSGGKGDEGGI